MHTFFFYYIHNSSCFSSPKTFICFLLQSFCINLALEGSLALKKKIINLSVPFSQQQQTLNKLPPELRCRHSCYYSPTEHTNRRQNVQKNMYATCIYFDRASILHTTIAGWVGMFANTSCQILSDQCKYKYLVWMFEVVWKGGGTFSSYLDHYPIFFLLHIGTLFNNPFCGTLCSCLKEQILCPLLLGTKK